MLFRKDGVPRISLNNDDPLHHIEVTNAIVAEMDRRLAYMRENYLDKIEYGTPEMPLLCIIFEEYSGIISAMPSNKEKAIFVQNVKRITQESAKCGIRIAGLLTQRFLAEIVDSASRANLGLRILFRSDNLDSARLLFDLDQVPESIQLQIAKFKPGVGLFAFADTPRLFRSFNLPAKGFDTPYLWYVSTVQKNLEAAENAEYPESARLTSLPLTLGVDQFGEPVVWDIVKDATHAATGGQTRSGKSYYSMALLSQITAAAPFTEVWGCDASGILLSPFCASLEESKGVIDDV